MPVIVEGDIRDRCLETYAEGFELRIPEMGVTEGAHQRLCLTRAARRLLEQSTSERLQE